MAKSEATTVSAYLKELEPEQRAVVSKVRDVIRKNLPKGYEEVIASGMISYQIPLETYPDTYNGQPLAIAALAATKSGYSLYSMGAYSDPAVDKQVREGFKKAGKKLDMGKSCIRFRKLEDLPLDVIGELIRSVPPKRYIELQEKARKK